MDQDIRAKADQTRAHLKEYRRLQAEWVDGKGSRYPDEYHRLGELIATAEAELTALGLDHA